MLITKDNTCLMLFNLQKDFLPSLQNGQNLLDNCCWLADVAEHFNLSIIIVTHKDLGEPLKILKDSTKANLFTEEVIAFSCLEQKAIYSYLQNLNKKQLLLAGAETHISLLQSAFYMKESGYDPFVIIDASTTRHAIDHEAAINRLNKANITLVSREMVFFELLRNSEYPNYLNMSLKFLDGRYIRT